MAEMSTVPSKSPACAAKLSRVRRVLRVRGTLLGPFRDGGGGDGLELDPKIVATTLVRWEITAHVRVVDDEDLKVEPLLFRNIHDHAGTLHGSERFVAIVAAIDVHRHCVLTGRNSVIVNRCEVFGVEPLRRRIHSAVVERHRETRNLRVLPIELDRDRYAGTKKRILCRCDARAQSRNVCEEAIVVGAGPVWSAGICATTGKLVCGRIEW